MSGKSNEVKAEQLGMPFGTASHRLRKLILFNLLVKAKDNFCFKCKGKIGDVADLSIEHKEPWLYSDDPVKNFFDLENIAFSHLRCNRNHRPGGKRKVGPPGTVWCTGCQDFRQKSCFGKNPRPKRRRIERGHCNDCRKKMGWG